MFNKKGDCADFLSALSSDFFVAFWKSSSTLEKRRLRFNEFISCASKFHKNTILSEEVISLVDQAFFMYDQGLRQMPCLLVQKASVYWKWENPRPKVDPGLQEKILNTWSALLNEVINLEYEFISPYWDSVRWPKAVHIKILRSIDNVIGKVRDEALLLKVRELIDEGFDLLYQGDVIGALTKIHLAKRTSIAIDTQDKTNLFRKPKPWDTEVLPDEPWIIGV